MTQGARILAMDDLEDFLLDGKIVAIRWDLLPWGIVLDLDYYVNERASSEAVGRGWLVFDAVNAFWCPITEARLVNGMFVNSKMLIQKTESGFTDYSFGVMLPSFDDNDVMALNPTKDVTVRCNNAFGIASYSMKQFGQFGPQYDERQALCEDREMIEILRQILFK